MDTPRIKPAIALSEAEEREAYPHPGRRLSKYEVLNRPDREKPLPRVPVPVRGQPPRVLRRKSPMRTASHQHGQSHAQLHSLSQTPASQAGLSSLHEARAADGAHTSPAHTHTLKATSSQPTKMVNKVSSFSRGASGRRSSQKINRLIGHELDLVDPYDRASFSSAAGYSEGSSSSNSGSGSDSDDDYDDQGYFINMEDGLLPLLLEVDEGGLSSREQSWVPRTHGGAIKPMPLNIRRRGTADTVGSVSASNGEHSPTSPTYSQGTNFGLSSELPMRWNPAFGQFTDKRAASDYHRFAAELATPYEREKSLEAVTPSPEPETVIDLGCAEQYGKKTKHAAKLSRTAAIIRLWDNSRPKDARAEMPPPPPPPPPLFEPPRSTSPSIAFRGNTLRKHRPSKLSIVDVQPPSPSLEQSLLHTASSAPSQMPSHSRQVVTASQYSAFDCDSDDEGRGRDMPRRWWRRSDEEERGASAEWPPVEQLPKPLTEDKEKVSFGGGVKGIFASARGRTLLSPAERRRLELRKSIRVLRAPGLEMEPRQPVKF